MMNPEHAEEVRKAIQRAIETFQRYESHHIRKDPPDMEKAKANAEEAYLLSQALSIFNNCVKGDGS